MKLLLPILTALLLFFAAPASAVNEFTTLILHASSEIVTCDTPQQNGLDCVSQLPVVDITGMAQPVIYLYVRNHDSLAGVQCAFEWPQEWTCAFESWECRFNQMTPFLPCGFPPGRDLSTVFNPITGGTLAPIGMIIFQSVAGGCLEIVESSAPLGTCVVSANQEFTHVPPANRGRICAGPGGYAACNPASTPVRAESWGRIKSSYR